MLAKPNNGPSRKAILIAALFCLFAETPPSFAVEPLADGNREKRIPLEAARSDNGCDKKVPWRGADFALKTLVHDMLSEKLTKISRSLVN